ncbi:hypothetical protein TBCH5v1_1952 [Thermococcus barophilus]|uniref:Uncharacterized protein n=2 Tax=Thermococcus barophilus TaxID=55802 RepID=A0A0S1XDT9_THEBA|nr:hypothetical protein TERMP_01617 [Thermococcus barophilus MP]ALM75856.1 hypothetical protein TBCH5v1_1952 [Thermococcus barophilus]
MEKALKEYEKRKKEAEDKQKRLKEQYTSKLLKKKKEILKNLEKLEKKEISKKIDDRIKKIVERERRSYVDTLRRTLERIENIEELGRFLPELSKLHISHGKYLLLVFEKEIYAINKLLKAVSEEYSEYIRKVSEISIEPIELDSILSDIEYARRQLENEEGDLRLLKNELGEKEREFKSKIAELEKELEKIESEIRTLNSLIAKDEIEIRSKISKLQKPIKRMRTGEKTANEILKDSSYGIEHPEEFLSFLIKIRSRLEGKYKQTADWILENLESKSKEIQERKRKLRELENKRAEILREKRKFESEIEAIKKQILEQERRIKRLKDKLLELEKELDESLSKLEKLLNTSIDRP